MSRLRRLRRWWPAIPVAFAILLIFAAWPGHSTYTISPETTHITEPMDSEGYIDYPTALNERLSKGITPENNANALIWQALGPRPEGALMPPEYFQWLGIAQPPEQGEYFVDSDKYFHANLSFPPDDILGLFNDDDDDERDWKQRWDDRLDRSRKWPWKANEQADIAEWLKRNEKPLAIIFEATRRPEYYNPLVSKSKDARQPRLISTLIPSVQKCRSVASALKSRAMCRLGEGDLVGAWQDLMTCQRLGRLMMRGSSSLIENLVGIAVVAVATDGQITFLSQSNGSSKQILGWLDDLRKLPPVATLTHVFDIGERYFVLDSMQSLATGGIEQLDLVAERIGPSRVKNPLWARLFTFSIDWDPAFRNTNRLFNQLSAATNLEDHASRKLEFAKLVQEIQQRRKSASGFAGPRGITLGKTERGEKIGDILLGLLLSSFEKIHNANERTVQQQLNLQVAFALAAYRADHDEYPEKLDDLAPKYLTKIPGDMFSGSALVYKPTEDGYLFYSVGVNEMDEEGHWIDDDPRGDDLRVRMPVPEPKSKAKPKSRPRGRLLD